MADERRRTEAHRSSHWRRDAVELAALFTAVTVADTVTKTVLNAPAGPVTVGVGALTLLGTAGFHTWFSHRRSPGRSPDGAPADALTDRGAPGGESAASPRDAGEGGAAALWRMRTTVVERPGSLAALCTALAERRIDILSLQAHPLGERTADEFLLRAPAALEPAELRRLAARAGGTGTWLERADTHDLVDAPARMLELATRTALDEAELPLALRQLLGRCTVAALPAEPSGERAGGEEHPGGGRVPAGGVLEGTVLRLPDPAGGTLRVERPHLPFTPTEFARARALVGLDATLGRRVPRTRDALSLPEGRKVSVRRADARDAEAARELHARCSQRTLSLRYRGPAADADRYLGHLLSPRFGRTLAAETASGKIVALGHLLWDGEETEVALLVEDAWQRRGIGGQLLRRLLELAREAGSRGVYAVTQSHNTAMVAAMRALGLPLEYQVEEGTLVITARLEGPAERGAQRPRDGACPEAAPAALG
jgi:GNAT superfamily N-acetyltransferase